MPLVKKQMSLSSRFALVTLVIVAVLVVAVTVLVQDLIKIETQVEKNTKNIYEVVIKNANIRQKIYQLTYRTQSLEKIYLTDKDALIENNLLIDKELQNLKILLNDAQFLTQINLFIEDLQKYLGSSLTINNILEERKGVDLQLQGAVNKIDSGIAEYESGATNFISLISFNKIQQSKDQYILGYQLVISLGARINAKTDRILLVELEKEMQILRKYLQSLDDNQNLFSEVLKESIVGLDQYLIVLRKLQVALSQRWRVSDALLISQASLVDAISKSESQKATDSLAEVDTLLERITLLRNFIIGTSLLIIILGAVFFAMIVRRHINYPINSLIASIERFEAGKFKKGVKLNRYDEWYTIEKAFNKMASRLDETYSQLISERRSFDYMAHHDPLTGLANRLLAYELITNMIGRYHLNAQRFSIIYLDLDEFKQVNDSLGHAIGDELLLKIAKKLHAIINTPDTAVRLGGDEFMILVAGENSSLLAFEYARKIIKELKQPVTLHSNEIFLGCSIGICHFPDHGDDVDALIRNADTAMYQAKKLEGEKICIYEEHMTQVAVDLMHKISGIRQALEKDEFFLEYQPQFDLNSHKIVGVEALIRWQHPEFGVLYPDQFLSIAERSGLSVDVDQWVFDTVLNQIKNWRGTLFSENDFKVSVNFSGKKFADPELLNRLKRTLENTDCDASNIEIEITEQDLMTHMDYCVGILKQLKALGFSIAIDDFGTGYSSFGYLKNLPVNTLKIDKIFISDINANNKELAIVKTMLSLSSMLDLTVVAEGVETDLQKVLLQSHGCFYGQGYLLAKPMSAQKLETVLLRGKE